MVNKVSDLTLEQFRLLIEEIIDQKFMEYLGDPDVGRKLRPEVIKRLKAQKRSPSARISMEQICKELGIKLEE